MLIWGQFSGLSRASHLACAHFSPVRVHPDGHASVSQGGFRRQGFWGVGRTSSGLASPSSFVLPRLKASSAHASGWEIPLTTRTRKLWSLCLSPNQGPMLLLVSCLEASAGDQLQLLSPWPICLLALTHRPTLPCGFPERRMCSKLHNDPKEEDSSEKNSQHTSEDNSASVDKDVSTSSEVTVDSANLPHSECGRTKVEVLDGPASKIIIIMINI